MTFKIPGGKKKGTPLDQAAVPDIEYWLNRISRDLAENPNKQYADKDEQWCEAARAELARRNGSGGARPRAARPPAQPQQSSTALARQDVQQLVIGTFAKGELASKALLEAAANFHLVAPATVAGSLPEGCEIAVNLVQIDPYGPEVYQITGKKDNPTDNDTVGIDRVGLARIAAAAGVTWESSRRTDDGSHPHYCAWEAIGQVRLFDGQIRRVPGNVDIDTLEDGELRGAAAEEIRSKAGDRGDGGDKQLLELRKFITRHAESKAMNRVVAALGVRRSYKRSELNKAFAVARLIFTGRSDDPEARREFRQMIGQSFMGSTAQLYSGQAPAPARPAAASHALPQPASHAYPAPPPPIGSPPTDDDYYDTTGEGEPASTPRNTPPPQAAPSPAPQSDDYDRGPNPDSY